MSLQQQFFEMLMESQYWSEAQLVAYQRSQLEQLLRHARKNVPFYEHRLDAVFTPSGEIDWDKWTEIPIVRRSDMLEHRDAMLARGMPKGHGGSSTLSTSGSTGLPVQITSNRLTVVAANANRWRAHRWHDLDWARVYTARDGLDAEASWPDGARLGPWGPPWDSSAAGGHAFRLSRNATIGQTLEFVGRTGSRYFSSGPKTLHAMALEVERLGLDMKLDCALTQGEHLGEEDKSAIRRVFGARTLEHYSSKEGGQIAYACPTGHGLHISAESVLIEIVDADGRPCAPGEPGRVIVTPFVSTAQPLIRYDQGDFGRAGQSCACGRGLPVLEAIDGRTTVIFTHPDGRKAARTMNNAAREALRCSFWQIAQTGPLQFEVRYVPRDADAPADEATAEAMFRSDYFEDAEVRFVRTASIPLSPAGKYLEYVVEWHPVV